MKSETLFLAVKAGNTQLQGADGRAVRTDGTVCWGEGGGPESGAALWGVGGQALSFLSSLSSLDITIVLCSVYLFAMRTLVFRF